MGRQSAALVKVVINLLAINSISEPMIQYDILKLNKPKKLVDEYLRKI